LQTTAKHFVEWTPNGTYYRLQVYSELKSTLRSVQAWRAISVLAVVIYHLGFEARRIWSNTDATILNPLNRFGFCGVDVFFVISGFIIVYTNFNKLGQPNQLPNYLWNRLTRIYPAYILISLPSFIEGMHTHQLKWKSLLGAALLIWPYPFLGNPVAWSLCYEIGFYLLFSLAFVLPQRFLPFMLTAWAVCVFGESSFDWFHKMPDASYLVFTVLNVPILLGAAAALLVRKELIVVPRVCIGLAAVLFAIGVAACLLTGRDLSTDLVLRCGFIAIPAFLLIYGAVGDEIRHARIYPKWLLFTGDASYSIYLCHYQMIMLAEVTVLSFKSQIHPLIWQSVAGLLAVTTGLLMYVFLEKPLIHFLHRKGEDKGAVAKPAELNESPTTVGAGVLLK
jgi:peptidoglycan/LPS O-acetylase OafA/YrhL